jgi:DNA polymerase-3 subunit epsilon
MRWLRRLRPGRPREDDRWVVVDTETSGLDASRDALLAIGAVAIDANGVRAGDSFEAVLRRDGPTDRHNVALHGIGREAQLAGAPCDEAIAAFLAWAGTSPRIAFHADFDRAFLEQAARRANVAVPRARWLDVAPLAAALADEHAHKDQRMTLDDWLAVYGIGCATRHNAASDALATAELVLRLRSDAARQRATTLTDLERVARQARWLGAR